MYLSLERLDSSTDGSSFMVSTAHPTRLKIEIVCVGVLFNTMILELLFAAKVAAFGGTVYLPCHCDGGVLGIGAYFIFEPVYRLKYVKQRHFQSVTTLIDGNWFFRLFDGRKKTRPKKIFEGDVWRQGNEGNDQVFDGRITPTERL